MDLTQDSSKPTPQAATNHLFLDLTNSRQDDETVSPPISHEKLSLDLTNSQQDDEAVLTPVSHDKNIKEIKLRFVDLCGQVMSDGLFHKLIHLSPEEYQKIIKVRIQKALEESCDPIEIFRNQQSLLQFENKITSSLNHLQKKSLFEVVQECRAGAGGDRGLDDDLKYAKKRSEIEIQESERKKKKIQQNEDDRTCIICLDSPRTHLIIPCFHFIACEDCIQNFAVGSECPVCRTRVMETKQVFTS
jgi:hypothetical protein